MPVFAVFSGLLLFLAGFRSFKNIHSGELLLSSALILITAMGLKAPSYSGITRMVLVSSALGIFLALRSLDIKPAHVLLPLVSGGGAAMVFSLLNFPQQARLGGYMGNPNLMGSYAAVLLVLGAGLFFSLRGGRRFLLLLLLVPIVITLYRTGTRSSLAALLIALPLSAILFKRPRSLPWMVLIFAASAALIYNGLPSLLFENNRTMQARLIIWKGGRGIFADYPVFGRGTGSFQSDFPEYRDPDFEKVGVSANTAHAHSEYLETLAENGLTGFLILLAAIYFLLRKRPGKQRDPSEIAATVAVLILLIEAGNSVALRWTPSVFLLASTAGVFTGGCSHQMNSKTVSAVFFLMGLVLAVWGGITGYRMAAGSLYLGRSQAVLDRGGSLEEAMALCERSLEYSRRNPGAWYTLGNVWGAMAPGLGEYALRRQVECYDSLGVLYPNFAWMRYNRMNSLIALEEFDRAMDDAIAVYAQSFSRRDYIRRVFYAIAPAVSSGKALMLMNLELSEVLKDEYSRAGDPERSRLAERGLQTTYALSAGVSPDTAGILFHQTDSILSGVPNHHRLHLLSRLSQEVKAALRFESNDHYNFDSLTASGAVAPLQTAQRLMADLEISNTGNVSYYIEHLRTNCFPCNGIIHLLPEPAAFLEGTILLAAKEGDTEDLFQCGMFLLIMDAAGYDTFLATGLACDYWVRIGGPGAVSEGVSEYGTGLWHSLVRISEGDSALQLRFSLAGATLFHCYDHSGEYSDLASEDLERLKTIMVDQMGYQNARQVIDDAVNELRVLMDGNRIPNRALPLLEELSSLNHLYSP